MKSGRRSIKAYKLIFCLLVTLSALTSTSEARVLPSGWESMEIEAKWDATETVFNAIVAAFPAGGQKYGYNLNVRWAGIPKKYADKYYDNSTSDLFNGLHMLRHRQRYRTFDSIAITDSFVGLENANWNTLDWEKVQYKSTPTRLSAVWFRNEQGDAQLSSTQVSDTLAGNPPHPPYTSSDDPIALLLSDHPGFNFSDLSVALEVVQFRYRVEFLDPLSGNALYELSLDKIVTTVPGQSSSYSYGVELEVLKNGVHVEGSVNELFVLMQNMEAEFNITRATTSKGGVEVVDSDKPTWQIWCVRAPCPCFIGAATSGSRLESHVQSLREFRDEKVLSTHVGKSFMTAFNSWYYPFSFHVAEHIENHSWLRQIVKIFVYPLIGILLISEKAYSSVGGEYGVLLTFLVTGFMAGAVYCSPFVIPLGYARRRKFQYKTAVSLIVAGSMAVAASLVMDNHYALMVSTLIVFLAVLSVSAVLSSRLIWITLKKLGVKIRFQRKRSI